jgi:RNA polymerase sigma-70 factor (ECF subfamily)
MSGLAHDAAPIASTVRMAADGDRVAFARIVDAYHADMVRVAFVVAGGDQGIADDAAQSAWEIAWRKLRSVREPDHVKGWLLTVAANEARRLVRRQRRAHVIEIPLDPERIDARDRASLGDDLDLEAALARLTPDERALLALRYVAGLDSFEIGALSHASASSVRGRLARLVARLRKELSDA